MGLFLVLACTSFLPSKCYIWLCDVLVRVEHVPLLPNLFLGTSPAAGRVGLTNVGGRSGVSHIYMCPSRTTQCELGWVSLTPPKSYACSVQGRLCSSCDACTCICMGRCSE